jgi:N-acetyl-gamma-glutamyl-phosphate reductase
MIIQMVTTTAPLGTDGGGPLQVGVIGASGYTGAELLRLLDGHPTMSVELITADTMAGRRVSDLYPSLAVAYPELVLQGFEPGMADGLDLVFLGLPHEASMEFAPALVEAGRCVVDLSAAFRLRNRAHYLTHYGFEHSQPELLASAVFGLPEFHRDELKGAHLVATPGCHVTAAVLALRPLVEAGVVADKGIIVDTLTGVTGAGRAPTETNVYANIESNATAYGLIGHRHTPEMEQQIGAELIFTPHLVPMSRGLLATCYATAIGDCSTASVLGVLGDRYREEPFVHVSDRPPSTKAVLGSNAAHVSAVHDPRTNSVIAMCAIDNLTKGASGGALQAANVALGLDETAGLTAIGLAP